MFSEKYVLALQDGRVLDRASDQLSKVRGQRRGNMQSLRQSMSEWARKLAAQNVSEEALVVIRRDRLCVPVKAGRQVGTRKKRKQKTTPFGVNVMRSQVLYWDAQEVGTTGKAQCTSLLHFLLTNPSTNAGRCSLLFFFFARPACC